MQGYFAAVTVLLLILLVIARVVVLRRAGIQAMKFGAMDKKDFLIPPFALLFVYLVLAGAFNLPRPGSELFHNALVGWLGVVLCLLGLLLFLWALISFGKSFRVGIDEERPNALVTTGAFSISRNPIYTAFGLVLLGTFLIISNWILLVYVLAGAWLLNRQVLREEASLKKIYGGDYGDYCKKVRRYL